MRRLRLISLLLMLAMLLYTAAAHAFTPPKLNGHVVDTAKVLTDDEVLRLDQKLDRVRQEMLRIYQGGDLPVFLDAVARQLLQEGPDVTMRTVVGLWGRDGGPEHVSAAGSVVV